MSKPLKRIDLTTLKEKFVQAGITEHSTNVNSCLFAAVLYPTAGYVAEAVYDGFDKRYAEGAVYAWCNLSLPPGLITDKEFLLGHQDGKDALATVFPEISNVK